MIYRSNLSCPDLSPRFKLANPAVQMLGHDVPTDPDFDPNCGIWTHEEAANLYNVAKQIGGLWLDIGSRFGWRAAHLEAASCSVIALDPEYHRAEFLERASASIGARHRAVCFVALTSQDYFEAYQGTLAGCVVDGCHDAPEPVKDAIGAHRCLAGAVLLHDFQGTPVQDAVVALLDVGFRVRIYDTPNGVALCWRDAGLIPPDHVPDPMVDWSTLRKQRAATFPFERCE